MTYIRSLSDLGHSDLGVAGGKGANLGALIRAGLPVPDGFCITTGAYRAFVQSNGLQPRILRLIEPAHDCDTAALENASRAIRALFAGGRMPAEIADEIHSAQTGLCGGGQAACPVAVRSSATAEDLPDLSFAGQQDTYLNVIGIESLLAAVVECWSSLWTARALGYRLHNAISQDDIALAVIVQKMVAAEASGVLFTANPLTGTRSQTVIEATLGLGEALVSGQVEPDRYVIDGAGIAKTLGAKKISVRGKVEGGTAVRPEDASARQALPDEQVLEIARLGREAAGYFQAPQDMEWAWADGRLYVLQSRPITSLYPLPDSATMPDLQVAEPPLEAYFCLGVMQGVLDPVTPLGRDFLAGIPTGMAHRFGGTLSLRDQRVVVVAGERPFLNVAGLFHQPIGRRLIRTFTSFADPVSHDLYDTIARDPRLAVVKGHPNPRTTVRVLRVLLPFIRRALQTMHSPVQRREEFNRKMDAIVESVRAACAPVQTLPAALEAFDQATLESLPAVFVTAIPVMASAILPPQILRRLAGPSSGLVLEIASGLPYNVTTGMDLALWETAQAIRAEPEAARVVAETDAAGLIAAYAGATLPPVVQTSLQRFLERYGMRAVAEIDLGRPRWHDDPTHILQALKSYLTIDQAQSPQAVFAASVARSREAEASLIAALRKTDGGRLKARLAGFLAGRIRQLAGLRETPKFTIVRTMAPLRAAFLRAGQSLVNEGALDEAADIFFLHVWELRAGERAGWRALVAARRRAYARELRRRRIPRWLLSDGSSYYEVAGAGSASNDKTLRGGAVSAGVAEGVVHIVLDPRGVQLAPGEILVCPATDPAWTPLFLSAGALVTEVGGMMTHGSVVAREYGIPAVVSVSQATTRLHTGQRVRVDGSNGVITILD